MAERTVAGRTFAFSSEADADGFDECIEQNEGINICVARWRGTETTPTPKHGGSVEPAQPPDSEEDEPDDTNPAPGM